MQEFCVRSKYQWQFLPDKFEYSHYLYAGWHTDIIGRSYMYVLITSESLRVNINLTNFASLFTLQALNQMKHYTMHCYLCMFKTVTSSIPLKFLKRWSWGMLIPTGWETLELEFFSTLNYWWASDFEWIWQFWVWFFFFLQATLLLLMQGFAEKGDVEGTLWVHSSVRNNYDWA